MRILVINGPNLNLLGRRDPSHYGNKTLEEMNIAITDRGKELDVEIFDYQSNHEGDLIDYIQVQTVGADGIIINPGALTHYGLSLMDALIDSKLPVVEVHLSDIHTREEFRRHSVIEPIAVKQISGKGWQGYLEALEYLVNESGR